MYTIVISCFLLKVDFEGLLPICIDIEMTKTKIIIMSENRYAIENVNSVVYNNNIDCLIVISSLPCFYRYKKSKKALIRMDKKAPLKTIRNSKKCKLFLNVCMFVLFLLTLSLQHDKR